MFGEKPLKNARHEQYCLEYLVDLNQSQAAIRTGYSPLSAGQQASELMKNPKIRARIDFLMAERSRRTGVNADRVVRELARIAFVNATDVINMDDASLRNIAAEDDTAAIASVKVKIIPGEDGDGVEREIKLADKIKALELLGKHLSMFTDKVELSGGVKIDDARARLAEKLSQRRDA